MPFPLSPRTIEVLSNIISGGPGTSDAPPRIGLYRTGPQIERFMRSCNVEFRLVGSRVPSLTDCLIDVNNGDEAEKALTTIIEEAANPGDFVHEPDRFQAVVARLNETLRYDGFELRQHGDRMRLGVAGHSTPALERLSAVAETISFDTVRRDLDRALASVETDPEDAVTSACSTIESVCRSILVELGEPLPSKKDIQGLFGAVKRPLGLSGDRADLDPSIADDVRMILSGIATVVHGIGSLRTHGGDAHGRERGYVRIDARIARLSIHAASTIALFLIETWQRKFPARALHRHDMDA